MRNKGTGMRVIKKDDHPTHHAGKNQKDQSSVDDVETIYDVVWYASGCEFKSKIRRIQNIGSVQMPIRLTLYP